MSKKGRKVSSRMFAFILANVIAFTTTTNVAVVNAATDTHPDAITISVVDEEGVAVENASVAIKVDSVANGEDYISETKVTDANGVVEVIPSGDFVTDDLTVSATVTAAGYSEGILEATGIESGDADYKVVITSTLIKDVTLASKGPLTYIGEAQELVLVTKKEGDTVTYVVDGGEPTTEVPKRTNAGTYTIQVTVSRDGKDDFVDDVETTINPADITDINIEGKSLAYNGAEQELVTVTGIKESDEVTWTVNGVNTESEDVPKKMAADTYQVNVTVNRENYNEYTAMVETIIYPEIDLGNLVVTGLNGVYTYGPQDAVSVDNENEEAYTLQYKLDNGAWQNEIPKVELPGSYIVWVKAVKENHNDKDVTVIPAENAVTPYNVYIAKLPQSFAFDDENYVNGEYSSVTVEGVPPFNKLYDFGATDTAQLAGGTITYSLEVEDDDIATINSSTGELTVNYPGAITVCATLSGDAIYEETTIRHTLAVSAVSSVQGEYVSFANDRVNYVVGENEDVASENIATKTVSKDKGTISYSIANGSQLGLSIDSDTGEVTVNNYKRLLTALETNQGTLPVEVRVDKSADIRGGFFGGSFEKYSADYATYILNVTFESTPAEATTVSGNGNNVWYNSELTVTPAAGYTVVAKNEVNEAGDNFAQTASFNDQGSVDRYVYLKAANGGITAPVKVQQAYIDTIAPEAEKMTVKFPEFTPIEKLGIILGFFKPDVTITFTVDDELGADESGVDYIEWSYAKDTNATSSIATDRKDNRADVTLENGKYVAKCTIPLEEAEQYRGYISFVAYDKAGNRSDVKYNDAVIVVDDINPNVNIRYELIDINGIYNPIDTEGIVQHYYNGSVDFTLTVKEANFFGDDVDIEISKDGMPQNVEVNWSVDASDDETNYGKFTLNEDGDYIIKVSYKDNSGNAAVKADDPTTELSLWTSEVITIDTTKPIVSIDHVSDAENQKTTFTVVEKNFNPQHITISAGTTVSGNSSSVSAAAERLDTLLKQATWTKNGDTYTYVYDDYEDGYYKFIVNYKDYCEWEAQPCESEEFVIDHQGPTDVKIEYLTEPIEIIKEALSFGYYKPSVTVKFSARDSVSGVNTFTWKYTKQSGASTINHPSSKTGTINATHVEDDLYTAEMTLTADQANQYRGYISVLATDQFSNESNDGNMIDDSNNILVIDTVAPTLKVEYPESIFNETINGKKAYYYNSGIAVSLIVTEANFRESDIKVTVTKDGKALNSAKVSWGNRNSNDETVGTLNLGGQASGDGEYVIKVEYKDRCLNEMTSYESDVHIVDTTLPEIKVEYKNTAAINTLNDIEGNNRKYYADTQTAVVTITERNFSEDKVEFKIDAKEVNGASLNADGLHTKSSWSTGAGKDVHTLTITYPGDANYTFDVSCIDKASNESKDYPADCFTVDKTKPENVSIDYSASLLDTVLEAITFGFYNSTVTVTVTAEDRISGVDSFNYSYIKAIGVSDVNSELIGQQIERTSIQYSDGGKTAKASFEVPRDGLSARNQFNGLVEVSVKDTCGNETEAYRGEKRLVVDNIAPTAQISYNEPSNTVDNISYYDGDIDATITITEANFYSEDVVVTVTKDGGEVTEINPSWSDSSVDVHEGRFSLTEDGDYIINVKYTDKSTNQMEEYVSEQMTIDTQLEVPVIKINGDVKTDVGGAYKGDVKVEYSFEDKNFDTSQIKLIRTRFDKVEDVTENFIEVAENNNGGSGSFVIPAEVANDGIYVISVGLTDKALHTEEVEVKYTVNRYGSVYEYDNALIELIKDGGQYVKEVDSDLVITEYNADRLLKDSLKILITRDGETIDAVYTSNPKDIDEDVMVADGAWYKYVYTINASNFAEDGVYKISLSSEYAADDSAKNESASVPENSIDKSGNRVLDTMTFTVDSTAPQIRNVVNLEEAIVNETALDVKYTVVDVGGLKSVEVILNGESVDKVTEFGESVYTYSGEFTINESADAQTVQLKILDLAGNVTDTAREDFSTGDLYIFNDTVTVSTNMFVRWYADKPVFWGTIGGMVFLSGAAGFIGVFVGKRRRIRA